MRWDMFKVIVERPRRGGGCFDKGVYERRFLPAIEADRLDLHPLEIPCCEGMNRRGRSKYLNEHLGPLKRFLLSRVGRAWNEVFSEICEHLKLDSVVQRHVREHLEDFVAIHVYRDEDGRVWDKPRYHFPVAVAGRTFLYVDPDSGILIRYDKKSWRQVREEQQEIAEAKIAAWRRDSRAHPWDQFQKVRGIWYRCRLERLPQLGQAWDALHACRVSEENRAWLKECYGRSGVYAARKAQASRKELLMLGVRNDAQEKERCVRRPAHTGERLRQSKITVRLP